MIMSLALQVAIMMSDPGNIGPSGSEEELNNFKKAQHSSLT